MAAPTSVRVYATSQTTAVLRWTYPPANTSLTIHRSTDGSIYSVIATLAGNAGTTSYIDTALSAGTKYWYKLSDNGGSTFSSVVTVYSHTCFSPAGDDSVVALPRTNGEEPAKAFDELAERVENALNSVGREINPNECTACPTDGAIVIDCSQGCNNWVVIADEDINSISVQWCEGEGNIDFIIPPNSTRRICGWPGGFGFTGDECQQSPLVSGSNGRTFSVGFECGFAENNVAAHLNSTLCKAKASKSSSSPSTSKGARTGGKGGTSSGGGGGSSCSCVPSGNGALTIKSCNANNSLNCSSTKSLKLLVCGGKGPYSWNRTGSIQLKGSTGSPGATAAGTSITVTPPTNSGSGVAGTAYKLGKWHRCNGGFNAMDVAAFGCNDQTLSACSKHDSNAALKQPSPDCVYCGEAGPGCVPSMTDPVAEETNDPQYGTGGTCISTRPCNHVGTLCDARSASMISNGCNPCGLQSGTTVTVTDAVGTQTTIILTA